VEYYETADLSEENTENTSHILGSPKGFSLVIGDMADGETIDFHYRLPKRTWIRIVLTAP
jgi:hypothetical protein